MLNGYSNLGYSGRASYSDLNPSDEPPQILKILNSNLGYNDLKFQPLCSEVTTVNGFEVAVSDG